MGSSEAPAVHPWRMLYSTLALWVFAIFSLVSTIFVLVVWFSYDTVNEEQEQILNWTLASDFSRKLEPFLEKEGSYWEIQQELDELVSLHRGADIYLLNEGGEIIGSSRGNERLEIQRVSLAPILSFLKTSPAAPGWRVVYGDSPRDIRRAVPFSATKIQLNGQNAYLYVTLVGGTQRILFDYSKERVTVLICAAAFSSLLVIAIFLGIWFRRLLTIRLMDLVRAAGKFQSGDLSPRIRVKGNDELAMLGSTFNQMAGAIEKQIQTIEEKDKNRRDLISDISHDLRSPAAVIQGYSELLLQKNLNLNDAAKKYIEVISRNSGSLQKLLSELFELARLDSDQAEVHSREVAVEPFLRDLALRYEVAGKEKGIQVTAKHSTSPLSMFADPHLLERTLGNLVENALRYTSAGGQVLLSAEEKGDKVRVAVADTGIGMESETMERIFERTYQDAKQSESQKGLSGLGLAIVRKLVQAQGGEIQVESRVGEGSVFWFELPKSTPTAEVG